MGSYRIGAFNVDVTPPIGHALCGGLVDASTEIRDPLSARGFVILGCGDPIVYAVFDWCEFRNDAHYQACRTIAQQICTSPERVLLSTYHPHDSPIFDLYAENLLRERGIYGLICDIDFYNDCISRVSQAIKQAIEASVPLTEVCVGEAKVERVASNRRIPGDGIRIKAWRGSSVPPGSELMDEPEGLIDPYLKTIVFKSYDTPVVALNCYATHPMSYYGTGRTSADFCGDARRAVKAQYNETLVIYANGCGGNIAPGKYNNGNEESRSALAASVADAIMRAIESAECRPVDSVSFNTSSVDFRMHIPNGFSRDKFCKIVKKLPPDADREYMESLRLSDISQYMQYWNAVEGLSWFHNLHVNGPTNIACLSFGNTKIVALPGESFIQYQLAAQEMAPESFVVTTAYGDCGMGYIPVDSAWGEGGYEETESYVACGVEKDMVAGIAGALGVTDHGYVPTKPRNMPAYMRRWPYSDNPVRDNIKRILKKISICK